MIDSTIKIKKSEFSKKEPRIFEVLSLRPCHRAGKRIITDNIIMTDYSDKNEKFSVITRTEIT